ncbi:MAG: Ralstonia phage [Bacteroidota bacterium]|jgi:hypothetical protein
MNAFVNAVANQEARTENGMKARKSTAKATVDLFYNIGASRGKNITGDFTAAYVENADVALRIAQWARDVRGGAGERQLFRDILVHLEKRDPDAALALLKKVPEVGRWDDIFVFSTPALKSAAYTMLGDALRASNGLAAKWTPRKGKIAAEIRAFFGMSPKQYRKSLVALTKVVETQMCANDWDNINFSHVPSVAARNYKKAFNRHTPAFAEYVSKLVSGDKTVKVNASAIYPHDVLKGIAHSYTGAMDKTETDHVIAQWDALPNYVGDASILPLVDVSGSMTTPVPGSSVRCLDVAVGLGLYLADKNKGVFKDTFLTFSSKPQLVTLKGNIVEKVDQMSRSNWEMSTNLHAAMDKILSVAVKGNVPASDMPAMLLILSDMQFNQCARFDDSAMEMIERKYADAGYTAPQIVFWNLNSSGNVPVKADKSGAALVSGFSPSIMKALLSADLDQFTPEGIMLKTVMVPRYDL